MFRKGMNKNNSQVLLGVIWAFAMGIELTIRGVVA